MNEWSGNPALPDAPHAPRSLHPMARAACWAAGLTIEAAALLGFIHSLAIGDIGLAGWIGQVLIGVALLGLAVSMGRRRWRQIDRPLRKFESLLPLIRNGQAPIEELSQVDGRLENLARQVQGLLRELRHHQGQHDSEIRVKVANRTSALERKIGSLRQQATRDALTGLHNRRMFEERLRDVLTSAGASRMPLTLLMIDVDHFKLLNDALGHAAGDEFLRSIAQIVQSTIRSGDMAFRWGGDEFAILLEKADSPTAQRLIARLTSLADALVKTIRLPTPPGLSIGAATFTDLADLDPRKMVEAADRGLYQVKTRRKHLAPRKAS